MARKETVELWICDRDTYAATDGLNVPADAWERDCIRDHIPLDDGFNWVSWKRRAHELQAIGFVVKIVFPKN